MATASIQLEIGAQTFGLYATDGVVCYPCIGEQIEPNENTTYLLQYTLPFSAFPRLKLTVWPPFPVLQLNEMALKNQTEYLLLGPMQSGVPDVDTIRFGMNDTFFQLSGQVPTILIDSASQIMQISWSNSFQDPLQRASTNQILFTLKATQSRVGDGVRLVAFAQQSEG